MDTRILLAGGTIAGLVGGAAAGYIYAVKKLTREYDELFNEVLEEQLKKERGHYTTRIEELEKDAEELHDLVGRMRQVKRTPQVPEGVEAGDGLMEGPDVETLERVVAGLKRPEGENGELKYHVAAGSLTADRGAHIMGQVKPGIGDLMKARSEPLMITEESYMANEPEYYQIELTYFSDGVLIDNEENIIDEVNILLGEVNVKQFAHLEDDVVYICNHRRNSYFEVTLDKRTYEEVVAGLADGP